MPCVNAGCKCQYSYTELVAHGQYIFGNCKTPGCNHSVGNHETEPKTVDVRFQRLLVAAGISEINPKVMDLVLDRPRSAFCTTPEQAAKLYNTMDKLPQTYTIVRMATDHDIQVVKPSMNLGRSLVYLAMDGGTLCALKIPSTDEEAEHEFKMWEHLKPPADANLVGPCRLKELGRRQSKFKKPQSSGGAVIKDGSFAPALERKYSGNLPCKGIAMPMYVCSADKFRGVLAYPEITSWSWSVLKALRYMHAQGYAHNDVKASNILVDPQGRAFLGDYGASEKLGDPILQYTEVYWPLDLDPVSSVVGDFFLLAVTGLDLAGWVRPPRGFHKSHVVAEIQAGTCFVPDKPGYKELQQFFLTLVSPELVSPKSS